MKDHKHDFDIFTGGLDLLAGVFKIASSAFKGDLGCDWYCDNCDAHLNSQFGFTAGSTWTCSECGYLNDVSEDNIISSQVTDGGLEVLDIPTGELDDPEDY